ncbi:hypothetical protein OROGR_011518 [Orobanche gracilis]
MISTMTILQENAEDTPDFDDQYDDDFAPDLYNDGFPGDAEEPPDLDDLYMMTILHRFCTEPLPDHDDDDPVLDEDAPLDYDYCKKLLNKVSKRTEHPR